MTQSAMSEKFGVSRNMVSKKFKMFIGVSFLEFVDFVRIRRAEALLKSRPDLTIKEISEIVGIKKRQRFSEKFKKQYGLTPAEFRKLYK
jgi:AraC-like DNA-binding protein